MQDKIFEIGPIRPPSEANSLLLRVTQGCTWNKCRFCDLYRNTKFRFTPINETKEAIDIIADYRDRILGFKVGDTQFDHSAVIDDMNRLSYAAQGCYYMVYNWLVHGAESVFLQDANTMALKPDFLIEILQYLKDKLPSIKRITSYGRADSLARIETEQYIRLKDAGLNRIHSGFESGSDDVLSLINKGITSEVEIKAGKHIMKSGIELSIYFMPGVGGKDFSEKNAIETAKVINKINPSFVRLRTSVIKKHSELWTTFENENIEQCSDIEKVEEIALMLKHIEGCNGILLSDHIVNLLAEVEGTLDKHRLAMIDTINRFLSLPEIERKRFQLARRLGIVTKLADIESLDSKIPQLDSIIRSVGSHRDWENLMNNYLTRFI